MRSSNWSCLKNILVQIRFLYFGPVLEALAERRSVYDDVKASVYTIDQKIGQPWPGG